MSKLTLTPKQKQVYEALQAGYELEQVIPWRSDYALIKDGLPPIYAKKAVLENLFEKGLITHKYMPI